MFEGSRDVQFLGTPDTLVFVKALAKRGLFPQESLEYLLMASADGMDIPPTFTKPLRLILSRGTTAK